MIFEKDISSPIENNFTYDYIIEDFHLISRILKRNNENNFWTDFFNYLIRQIFDNEFGNYESNADESVGTVKSICYKDYKLIFFQNFDKVKLIFI